MRVKLTYTKILELSRALTSLNMPGTVGVRRTVENAKKKFYRRVKGGH